MGIAGSRLELNSMSGFYASEYSLIIRLQATLCGPMSPSTALPQLLDDGKTVCCYGGWHRISRKIARRKLAASYDILHSG
jgi:hypothetical protein